MHDLIGYLRDFVAAVFGLAILFGVNVTDAQVSGVLLVITTGGALGSYAWKRWRAGDGSPAGESHPVPSNDPGA